MTVRMYDNPFRIFIGPDISGNGSVWLTVSCVADKYFLEVQYINGEKIINEFDNLWEVLDSLAAIVKTLTKKDIQEES